MRSQWSGCKAAKIADIPEAKFLNGLATLPTNPSVLLVGDSGAGLVYSLDSTSGEYSVAIDDASLKPNASFPVTLGVNGIQFRPGQDDYVYFTNSFKAPAFGRMPIDPPGGAQLGESEVHIVSTGKYGGGRDDFTFDSVGESAYIANGALTAC